MTAFGQTPVGTHCRRPPSVRIVSHHRVEFLADVVMDNQLISNDIRKVVVLRGFVQDRRVTTNPSETVPSNRPLLARGQDFLHLTGGL